ncbi:MAG TPA: terminase small subunit, partial [Arenibaculum sp.]|nr:terminase small subunit [Arenibaculum sp.]
MEAATPTLSPRQELFCRFAALGHTLAEAARRAGYSPTSARQRGSELYARQQIQDRVAVLAAHEARLEDTRRDDYMSELREIRGYCKHYQQYGTALSALRAEIRLSGVGSRRAERRADDEETEADLRANIEA